VTERLKARSPGFGDSQYIRQMGLTLLYDVRGLHLYTKIPYSYASRCGRSQEAASMSSHRDPAKIIERNLRWRASFPLKWPTFESWKKDVDEALIRKCRLCSRSFVDWDYLSAYGNFVDPDQAAESVLNDARARWE
jgi:hypothetical protein